MASPRINDALPAPNDPNGEKAPVKVSPPKTDGQQQIRWQDK